MDPKDIKQSVGTGSLNVSPGDVVMCQVVKDHFGTKGVRISQNVSIPGRLLVIMPYVNFVGISHKIEDEDERKRLEQLVSSHQPQNIGFIVRTEAAKASDEEILAEMDKLVSKWKNILSSFQRAPVCTTVYEEGDLIFRTIRDFLSDDVDDIFVNNENVYRDLAEKLQTLYPNKKLLKYYPGEDNMFVHYGFHHNRLTGVNTVLCEVLSKLLHHRFSVFLVRHIYEVDNDDAADVSQAKLLCNLRRRNHIRFKNRLLEVCVSDEFARVDVDNRQSFGSVDDEIGAVFHNDFFLSLER